MEELLCKLDITMTRKGNGVDCQVSCEFHGNELDKALALALCCKALHVDDPEKLILIGKLVGVFDDENEEEPADE